MQANGGQLHEVEPADIHTPLQEPSTPETRRVPTSGEDSLPKAPSVTREAAYTAVIEALVLAALHALEAHVWDVKKRVAILERGEEMAEHPTVTSCHQGTTPRDHHASLR